MIILKIIFTLQVIVTIYFLYLIFRTFAVRNLLIKHIKTIDKTDPYTKDKLLTLLLKYQYLKLLFSLKSIKTIDKEIIADFEELKGD